MKNLSLVTALATLSALAPGQTHAVPKQGVQKAIIVVDHGFKPSTLSLRARRPVQLTFDVRHRDCASSVVFEGMKLDKSLTNGKKTVVSFTPKKAGTIAYACPMKMMTGKIVVK